jgi:SAM-dependent methyltransferase
MNCRHCEKQLNHVFLDLGFAPPSNNYLCREALSKEEITLPLKLYVCDGCWLVQTDDYSLAEDLFTNEYAYFSSTSKSWLEHSAKYAKDIIRGLGLTSSSYVIEIASNDGYLLKNFIDSKIPCLGIEPTDSTAKVAEGIGIPVLREFFGENVAKKLANKGSLADLICGNNVYAHVPDINDFTRGLKIILKPGGVINLEFPHLLRLIENNQFDTVYHEHFSYLSLTAVSSIFSSSGLKIFDVEELATHGGSLRIFGCHKDDPRLIEGNVDKILQSEIDFGLKDINLYKSFQKKAEKVKDDLLFFLIEQKRLGKRVAAYGAAAKGNTLMNYAGIKSDLIEYVCDASTSKQNRYTPGSHLQIFSPSQLAQSKPDWVVIFPWNIASEVIELQDLSDWGGRFVVAVPELRIVS